MSLEVLLRVVPHGATLHVIGALQIGHGGRGVHIWWELNARFVGRVQSLRRRIDRSWAYQVVKWTLLELDYAVDVSA